MAKPKTNIVWTKLEIDTLKRFYPDKTIKEIMVFFPQRTELSVRAKVAELGILKNKPTYKKGDKFNLLTIMDSSPIITPKNTLWKCKCICGEIIKVPQGLLAKRKGCFKCSHLNRRDKWQRLWRIAKNGAKKRNIEFLCSKEDIIQQFNKQNGCCALTGTVLIVGEIKKEETTASLDRIDSNQGYTLDNIQWVHKTINTMKMALSEDKFLDFCNKVLNHHFDALRNIKIKKTSPDAIIPTIGSENAAGFDIYSCEEVVFAPHEIKFVDSGISIEPPKNFRCNLHARSSLPKKMFSLANNVGIIDSDFRGTIKMLLYNLSNKQNLVSKGDKLCQLVMVPDYKAKNFPLNVVNQLSETQRGVGGFGSTD